MARTRVHSTSVALARLRFGVQTCCWIIGLALVAQIAAWSVTAFTEVRFAPADAAYDGPAVVEAPESAASATPARAVNVIEFEAARRQHEIDLGDRPDTIASSGDRTLKTIVSVATVFGRIGFLVLLPLIGLGALLAVAGAVPGLERTVSAFMLGSIVGVFILPLGPMTGAPDMSGAFSHYETLARDAEAWNLAGAEDPATVPALTDVTPADAPGVITYFARYLAFPAACLLAIVATGILFGTGVEIGIVHRESIEIDPDLEREAANIKATSLHGGGVARLPDAVTTTPPVTATPTVTADDDGIRTIGGSGAAPPSATQVSPGQSPGRII